MPVTKPLTYLSLNCVLKYTDPNIRLQLATVCPGFESTEKLVPLKIDQLNIKATSFTINDTNYNLGVIRHYADATEAPKWVLEINAAGGMSTDVGECEKPITRECQRLTMKDRAPSDEEYFEYFLQLTITAKNGIKVIERMKYDRKIKESMYYFLNKFLLGNRANLNVHTVRFDSIPEIGDFRFRSKHLIIGDVDPVRAQNSLDEIGCPLESMELFGQKFLMRPHF
ncbi:hypothetical protein GCK72_007675 [Caenorhabditis remanei]|uniref:DUF38 domain-containing protein n=1 Tax=Caenorhabditis remanei TaxID=31234 RepID=A0A6A5HM09_CAERE|nr:hypothetical protein GCK72_007675 [Caenorhabditis remanei]KAF1767716.1 hypothetical protein GCK72_007675 [Caenorhabditis remanei]